ncbi:MAG: hypothetical protein JWQ23_3531 [Herminiimonas sp.]|jgi:hypothetical protein|nr:hypothetical protein [Herminiimonas sp.]
MIFMSQSGLTDRSREAQWDAWYVEHLRIMSSVSGIASARRFKTDNEKWPPSLAMYSVRSPDVFSDPYYQKIRGMGEWLPLIDRRFYQRNLFEGLEFAPDVPEDRVLMVIDQDQPVFSYPGLQISWLKSVALDCSAAYRGISVVTPEAGVKLSNELGPVIAAYRPVF